MTPISTYIDQEFAALGRYFGKHKEPVVTPFLPDIKKLVEAFSLRDYGVDAPDALRAITLTIERLCNHQPISPVIGRAEEWEEVTTLFGRQGTSLPRIWQNRRCDRIFKEDGQRAYCTDVVIFRNLHTKELFKSLIGGTSCSWTINRFPFYPRTFVIDVWEKACDPDVYPGGKVLQVEDLNDLKPVHRYMKTPLRAISIKNPFATLMLGGKIETRKWATDYRGEVLLCNTASPFSDRAATKIMGEVQSRRAGLILEGALVRPGMAFAVARLVDCRPMTLADEDDCFVKYEPGLYCHIYKNLRRIRELPFKGAQGWKTLDIEFWDQLHFINPR